MSALYLADEAAQIDFGRRLALILRERAGLVFLEGDLGAGKTTLVRGLLRGLGVTGPVKSPTYTLIEPYVIPGTRGSWPVFHLDLYRLGDAEELELLGWRDLLDDGALLLIEWPQRGAGVLPDPQWRLRLRMEATGRRLELDGFPDLASLARHLKAP